MPFNLRMIKGQLSKEEYGLYLIQLKAIHSNIEKNELPHKDMYRTQRIEEDLQELTLSLDDQNDLLPGTIKYVCHLSNLSEQELLPHIYLNYLAIAYGGQFIKSKVPSGGKMYHFDNLNEVIQSIRNLQSDQWIDEVNKGYVSLINIFEDLENKTNLITKVN